MQFISNSQTTGLAVKQIGKFAVYVSCNLDASEGDDKIFEHFKVKLKEFVYDDENAFYTYIENVIHSGLFFFELEVNARNFYKIFNEKPIYSSGLYAELYSPDGQCLDENT